MRDTLLNDLINTLERHGCEIKVSIPTTRGRAERSSTDSDLGRRINTLRDEYGMTLAKIAELLTSKLNSKISVASVNAWTGGVTPRKVPYERVQGALEEIMEEHEVWCQMCNELNHVVVGGVHVIACCGVVLWLLSNNCASNC